ncbi:S24 family peptidase [Campylobacter hyointestinalis]|uniref:S24 family peptidase n=1 Tax=Campylobacter hyointestinalis TaxID=198 RepID=UPI001C675678|nr:S24 family peptidase [Campylobacter hyointestinalis]
MSLSMSLSQDINLSPSQDKYVSKSQNLSPNNPLNAPNLKKSQDKISISIKEDTIYVSFFKDGAVSVVRKILAMTATLPFKKQNLRLWCSYIGIIPCVRNSMQPTIEESELVVFQQDGTQSQSAIYVVRNELFVKRLKKRPLIRDNANYELINESQSFEILGRVIGSYFINSKLF